MNQVYGGEAADGLNGVTIARVSSNGFFIISQLGGQVKYLHATGSNVLLISSGGEDIRRYVGVTGVEYEEVHIERDICIRKDIAALKKLYSIMRLRGVQITHSTTPKAGLLTAIAALMSGVPIRLHTFTGQRWATLKGLKRRLVMLSDRAIGMLNTHCYADSASQMDFLIQNGIIRRGKISVVANGSLAGVDLKRFDPMRWTEEEKKRLRDELLIGQASKVIVYSGRLAVDKGIRELLQAFERLAQEGSDVDLLLMGPNEDFRDADDLFMRSGVKACERVHLIGYTDCPERYLALAAIFCLPSYREGFGTSVIEAAAMGVPTVGTDIDGLRDAIVHEETGVLVPRRDASALTTALRRLIVDGKTRERLGAAAKERCARLYDARIVSVALESEYCRMVKKRKCDISAEQERIQA